MRCHFEVKTWVFHTSRKPGNKFQGWGKSWNKPQDIKFWIVKIIETAMNKVEYLQDSNFFLWLTQR